MINFSIQLKLHCVFLELSSYIVSSSSRSLSSGISFQVLIFMAGKGRPTRNSNRRGGALEGVGPQRNPRDVEEIEQYNNRFEI